ncbi:hypothetical protein NX059_009546 [Plenodomus lindquistii]|nr:hypothetical protein NX059_009546 [Plenodomus lindquistii]
MPRAIAHITGMASNPYPRPKEREGINTFCELCDRVIRTLDWSAHKNSKKHREAEAKERVATEIENGLVNTNGFGGNSNGFTADTKGDNEFSGTDTFTNGNASGGGGDGWVTGTGGDAWGSGGGGGFNSTRSYGSNVAGGGGGGSDLACFGCGSTDHQKRDCPSGRSGGGQACYGCGETTHQKRDCPKLSGGGGQTCYNCGVVGHRKTECDQPLKPKVGGGGGGGEGRVCFNCHNEGHMSRDCDQPRVTRCRNCDEVGHVARECQLPTDWSKVKCRNCNNFGHGAGRCPNPPKSEETGGDSGAISGGWDIGDTAPEATGNWADDTTAAATGW